MQPKRAAPTTLEGREHGLKTLKCSEKRTREDVTSLNRAVIS